MMRLLFLWGLALVLPLGVPVGADISASEPLAEVNGEVINAEQVEAAGGAPLAKLHEQIHNLKRQKLEAVITGQLLVSPAYREFLASN